MSRLPTVRNEEALKCLKVSSSVRPSRRWTGLAVMWTLDQTVLVRRVEPQVTNVQSSPVVMIYHHTLTSVVSFDVQGMEVSSTDTIFFCFISTNGHFKPFNSRQLNKGFHGDQELQSNRVDQNCCLTACRERIS